MLLNWLCIISSKHEDQLQKTETEFFDNLAPNIRDDWRESQLCHNFVNIGNFSTTMKYLEKSFRVTSAQNSFLCVYVCEGDYYLHINIEY